jgi:hypothetical protein
MAGLWIEGTSPESGGTHGIAALDDGLERDQTVSPGSASREKEGAYVGAPRPI